MTLPGTTLGSVHYFSPEQARGEQATAASDIFSLGIVLFELLTGQRPWEGDSAAAVAMARLAGPAPGSGARSAPGIPPELAAITRKALALEPDDRWPTAAAFAAALEAFLAGTRRSRASRRSAARRGRRPPAQPVCRDRRGRTPARRRRTPATRTPDADVGDRPREPERDPVLAGRRRGDPLTPRQPRPSDAGRGGAGHEPDGLGRRDHRDPHPRPRRLPRLPAPVRRRQTPSAQPVTVPNFVGHDVHRRPGRWPTQRGIEVVQDRPTVDPDASPVGHGPRPGSAGRRRDRPRATRSSSRSPSALETVAVPDLLQQDRAEAFQLLFTAGPHAGHRRPRSSTRRRRSG